jgi:serine/threonine protein kinase
VADDASRQPFGLLGGLGPGSFVAGYQIQDRIGAGGMAVVFRARDERLGRLVALKVLAPALAADEEFRTRFIREWRSATAVEHPHIIPVYAADDAGDVLYIAMRLVTGGDLRSLTRREGPLDAWRAAGVISAVAAALDAAHGVGLVHRDVKPGNILIDSVAGLPDHVYLSDFGLSKGIMSATALTGTGQFLGTPDFAAPEQITGKRIDGRTDQYSLACVAFTLLTARPVYPRDEPMSAMFAHVQEPPPSAAALRPELPLAVDQVLARAMAKSPDDRYTTCGEFAAALRAAVSAAPDPSGFGQRSGTLDTATSLERSATVFAAPPNATARTGRPGPASQSSQSGLGQAVGGPLDKTESRAARQAPRPAARRRATWHGNRRAVVVAAALALGAAGVTAALLMSSHNGSSGGRLPSADGGTKSPRSTAAGTPSTPPAGSIATELNSVAGNAGYILAFRGGNSLVSLSAPGNGNDPCVISSWDLASPQEAPAQFNVPDGDNALSPDGSLAYAADVSTSDGPSYVWDTASGRKIATVPLSLKNVAPISNTGILAFAEQTGVTLWDAYTGTVTGSLPYPASFNPANSGTVAISPDGSAVALYSSTGEIYVWNSQTHDITATLPNPPFVTGAGTFEFSDDDSTLAVQVNSSTYIWDLSGQSHVGTLQHFLALSANGKLAAVAAGSVVNVVDVASGKVVRTLHEPSGQSPATVGAFNSDDTKLAAGNLNVDYVWNLAG